jgi:hypothetical protein
VTWSSRDFSSRVLMRVVTTEMYEIERPRNSWLESRDWAPAVCKIFVCVGNLLVCSTDGSVHTEVGLLLLLLF